MEPIVVTALICATILWITRRGLSFSPVLLIRLEQSSGASDAETQEREVTLDANVQEWINKESSDFYREYLENEARRLYQSNNDWTVVLAQLVMKHGE